MSAVLPREERDAIRARAEAATPGPWEADGRTIAQHWSRPEPWIDVVSDEVSCGTYCYGGTCRPIVHSADVDFIAHARTDVPALLDALDAAEAEVAALRGRIEGLPVMAGRTNTTTAAEVLAAHVLDEYANECSCKRWKHFEDPYDVRIASFAQHQSDALVRAGLLADPTTRTEVEWGVACPLDDDVIPTADPDWSVRHHDRNCGPGHRLVRRTVTDWTPAKEGPDD